MATAAVLLIALVCDVRVGRIPNWLTFPAMAGGLTYHVCAEGAQGMAFSAGGLAVGLAVFVVFYLLGGMGAGDVKLMAAVGALLGPKDALWSALATAAAGGVYAALVIAFHRATFLRYGGMVKTFLLTGCFVYVPGEGKTPRLRYAVPIAVGTMVVLLRGLQ